ncbi:MAG: 50S ribosomal protein L2 [Patescibacteria group bacterium]
MKKTQAPNRLFTILRNTAGRDNSGHISSWSRGGREKRFYRTIDWKRDKRDVVAVVESIEYDPNRSVNISLVRYPDGEKRFILHPMNLVIGDSVSAGTGAPIKPGCSLPLRNVPVGIEIHGVELVPGKGSQIIRSAGTSGVIIGKDDFYALIKLPSGEVRKVDLNCYATVGKLDNENRKNEIIGKAGRNRHFGWRPHVRGVAQHPNSHPHGGGEGRSGEGMHPKTPWGKRAKGVKTRNKTKASNKLIVSRRKK